MEPKLCDRKDVITRRSQLPDDGEVLLLPLEDVGKSLPERYASAAGASNREVGSTTSSDRANSRGSASLPGR